MLEAKHGHESSRTYQRIGFPVWALHMERGSSSHSDVHAHTHVTAALPHISCSLRRCFPLTLSPSDKFVLFAFIVFHSLFLPFGFFFFSSYCTYRISKKLFTLSVQPMEIKPFSWRNRIALSHKRLKRSTNTPAEGQRVTWLSFHLFHHYLERWARSTFISQAIIYLPIPPFVFQPIDTVNTAHLFNRIRR